MDSVSWTFKFCSWFVLTNLLQFVKDPNTRLKEELTDKTQVWHSWQAGTHRVDRKWVMNKTGSEQDRNTTSYDEVSIKLQDCDKYIKSWWKWLSWIMKAVIYLFIFIIFIYPSSSAIPRQSTAFSHWHRLAKVNSPLGQRLEMVNFWHSAAELSSPHT